MKFYWSKLGYGLVPVLMALALRLGLVPESVVPPAAVGDVAAALDFLAGFYVLVWAVVIVLIEKDRRAAEQHRES